MWINEPLLWFPNGTKHNYFNSIIITPIVTFGISYVAMLSGLVPYANGVQPALGTPAVLLGFLCVGWQGAILQVVLIGVQILIWLPFFKISDAQALKEEENLSA